LDVAIERYRRDLTDLIAASRERGVKILLMTQPTLYSEGLSPDLDALLWASCDDGAYTPTVLAQVMERYNQVLREVCHDEEVDLIDLAVLLPHDTTVFYDDCHFNISGCEKVASIVFEFFHG